MSTVSSLKLVFLIGCPRSGTSWVQTLISANARVATAQESDLFDLYLGPMIRMWKKYSSPEGISGREAVGLNTLISNGCFLRLLREFASSAIRDECFREGIHSIFLEKTPSHAMFMEEILEVFPDAQFVHLIRDPVDTVASLLAASRSWGRGWAPSSVFAASQLWTSHVYSACKLGRSLPRESYVEVKYENIASDQLQSLFSFMGLSVRSSECSDYFERNRKFSPERSRLQYYGDAREKFGPYVTEPKDFTSKSGCVLGPIDYFITRCVTRHVSKFVMSSDSHSIEHWKK
jgi:hypothetical protein